jgi:hypothetical protein
VKLDLEAAACLLVDSVGNIDKSDGGRSGHGHNIDPEDYL